MDFLEKIQKQPEHIRKIILWLAIIIIGLILAFFWIRGISHNLKDLKNQEIINTEELELPDFKKELEKMPEIEIPELNEEELKQLEQEMEKLENEGSSREDIE